MKRPRDSHYISMMGASLVGASLVACEWAKHGARAGLLAIMLLAISATAPAQSFLQPLWSERIDSQAANVPLLVELFADRRVHVVVTYQDGNVEARDGATGEVLWDTELSQPLTDPVSGCFTQDGSTDIVVLTKSDSVKRLYLLQGSTGAIIAHYELGHPAQYAATPFPIPMPNGALRHGIALTDRQGQPVLLRYDDATKGFAPVREIPAPTLNKLIRAPLGPPAVGAVFEQGSHDLVFTYEDMIAVIEPVDDGRIELVPAVDLLDKDHPKRSVLASSPGSPTAPLRTPAIVVDIRENERNGRVTDEIIVGAALQNSPIYAVLEYDPHRRDTNSTGFKNMWAAMADMPAELIRQKPFDPLAVPLMNKPYPTLVLSGPTDLKGFEGGYPHQSVFTDQTPRHYFNSPTPLIAAGLQSALLAFVPQSDGSCELRFIKAASLNTPANSFPLEFQPSLPPLVGELDGDDASQEILMVTSSRRLVALQLRQQNVQALGVISWGCRGGNIYRQGSFNKNLTLDISAQNTRAAQTLSVALTEAQSAYDSGDLTAAAERLLTVNSINPTLPEARALARNVSIRQRLWTIVAGVIAGGVLLGAGGFFGLRALSKRNALKKAEIARQKGDLATAYTVLRRKFDKYPRDPKIIDPIANVILDANEWNEANIAPLRAQHERLPDDPRVLTGLVRCYMSKREASRSVFGLYKRAEPLLPENSLLKFLIGLQFKEEGDTRLAQEYFRQAIKLPSPPPESYDELAELILQQQQATSKNIDILEVAHNRRPDHPGLLKGFAMALIDAKRIDPGSVQVYEKLLAQEPSNASVMVQLCKARLQAGRIDDSIALAQRLLELDPDHREGIHLLTQCYLIQGRQDDAALRVLRRAATLFPEDKEVAGTLARVFIGQKRSDEEAVTVYRHAFDLNPGDSRIAGTIAKVAWAQKDLGLVIRATERLIEAGQATPKNFQQLAEAYLSKDVVEEKAEKVYREALKLEPQNKKYLQQLARVYLEGKRTDPEAAKIFAAAFEAGGTFDIGKQLMRAHYQNEQWEEITRLAPRLLGVKPDDSELQKMFAHASLQNNRMDEAIVQFERVLKQHPDDTEALSNLAVAYAQKGAMDDRAVSLFRRALELNPNNDLVWMMMGRVALSRRDEEEAVQCYQRAAQCSDSSPDKVIRELRMLFSKGADVVSLRWMLADILVMRNRLREACEELGNIFETDPTQVDYVISGYDKILAKDPANIVALTHRGTLRKRQGLFEEAMADLQQAFEINPNNPDVQRELTDLYQAMLRERDDPAIRHELGKIFVALEEYDRAIGCFQRTAQDYRFENEATKALGLCFVQKGMLDLALQEFKKVPVDDEMKDILYDLAQRYETKKDLVGAKTVYKTLFAADIDFRDVRQKYESMAGSTSDPMAFERTMIQQDLSLEAQKRYELIDELGRGAMGIVYKARDNELDEVVALKILPEHISNNPEAVKRFRMEARAARRLAHPNIIRIHDIGEESGRKFISMEYVEGTDLKQKFRKEGQPDLPSLVRWTRDISGALDYAHRQGIVHRDIKPANIMITHDGVIKVADFGIAKALDAGENTMTGAVMGTPLYMSPEQIRGAQIDNRADIYSMGIMLYEFMTGRPPFTEGDLAYQHLNVEPKPIQQGEPNMISLVYKCLAKDREQRWRTCGELVDYLDTWARQYR